ncbi:unnamed protein product [Malus baccata var. baccata]
MAALELHHRQKPLAGTFRRSSPQESFSLRVLSYKKGSRPGCRTSAMSRGRSGKDQDEGEKKSLNILILLPTNTKEFCGKS